MIRSIFERLKIGDDRDTKEELLVDGVNLARTDIDKPNSFTG